MFLQINIYLRFALIAVTLIGGIALSILFGFWYAFPLILAGIVLLVGYVMMGTVASAAKMLQEGKLDEADSRLDLTLTPRLLYPSNRAIFYMTKGSVAMARRDMEEGEKWLFKAEAVKVPTDNEKAMVQVGLANIMANRSKWKQAETHYRKLKQLKITEPTIKEQVKQIDMIMKQRGQMKSASMGNRGQVMRPGGKRRRPKMR